MPCTLAASLFARDHFVLLLFTVLWARAFAHFHLAFLAAFSHFPTLACSARLVPVLRLPRLCSSVHSGSVLAHLGLKGSSLLSEPLRRRWTRFPSGLLHSRSSRLGFGAFTRFCRRQFRGRLFGLRVPPVLCPWAAHRVAAGWLLRGRPHWILRAVGLCVCLESALHPVPWVLGILPPVLTRCCRRQFRGRLKWTACAVGLYLFVEPHSFLQSAVSGPTLSDCVCRRFGLFVFWARGGALLRPPRPRLVVAAWSAPLPLPPRLRWPGACFLQPWPPHFELALRCAQHGPVHRKALRLPWRPLGLDRVLAAPLRLHLRVPLRPPRAPGRIALIALELRALNALARSWAPQTLGPFGVLPAGHTKLFVLCFVLFPFSPVSICGAWPAISSWVVDSSVGFVLSVHICINYDRCALHQSCNS